VRLRVDSVFAACIVKTGGTSRRLMYSEVA
jgi:hypothetical protein